MDEQVKELINKQISPLLRNGDITLFLGAGISIGTPAINGEGIPSSPELVRRICVAAGHGEEAAKTADLSTAFAVGADEIDNFENFLISNFTTNKPYEWQIKIFQNWWRAIFTTNIDTIPEKCIEINKFKNADHPDFRVFNYRDREPIESLPTSPPVIYLHGRVSKPNEGFIFDSVAYAEHATNQGDWLIKCALHISHGNCLFVGSRFSESDIEVALRNRKAWETESGSLNNWIVLRDFTSLEESNYKKRGITPIKADAKDFFEYLFSQVTPLTTHKFITKKAPFLSDDSSNSARAWFLKNMDNVQEELMKVASKKAPFSLFYQGAFPEWFYIRNNVPAAFSSYQQLKNEIIKFEQSDEKAKIIPVIGSLASGKTTTVMLALSDFSKTHNNVYQFSGLDGLDIEPFWNVVKDLKGLVIVFIDASSSYFYAVAEIVKRAIDGRSSCQICFVLEERSIHFDRNIRHFAGVPEKIVSKVTVNNLSREDASLLYDKTLGLGIVFEKLANLKREKAINMLVDFDQGYNGDLLATLYDLSFRKSYHEKLKEEYEEIEEGLAREIFVTISLVTASRLRLPMNYLCEIYSISADNLMTIINTTLKDKVFYRGNSMTLGARHHSIAQFHLENNVNKEELKDKILDLVICMSNKFTVDDIRLHPISYKIYRQVLSYRYLTDDLFKGSLNYEYIREIYSKCQNYFADDGVFWLQYGLFLERDNNLPEAEHCFRKGLALFDSFQLRHALGKLLLKKFRFEGGKKSEDFVEGLKLLMDEIESRGSSDAYPYNSLGSELIKLYESGIQKDFCLEKLKEIINRGMAAHRTEEVFANMVKRYMAIDKEAEL